MNALFATDPADRILFAQRLALAAVMFPHGAQKLLGWFGGYGFEGTMAFFTETMHLPAPLALLVILAESLGPLLLVLGLGTRVAALGISAVMIGAIVTTHASHGFFMNWFGQQQGEGFEFHILALALSVPLAIAGGGFAALDARLAGPRGRAVVRRGALGPQLQTAVDREAP